MSPRHRGRQPAATPINNPLGTRGEVNQPSSWLKLNPRLMMKMISSLRMRLRNYTKEFLSICSKAYQPALAVGKQQSSRIGFQSASALERSTTTTTTTRANQEMQNVRGQGHKLKSVVIKLELLQVLMNMKKNPSLVCSRILSSSSNSSYPAVVAIAIFLDFTFVCDPGWRPCGVLV